jgi:hypothetical protein
LCTILNTTDDQEKYENAEHDGIEYDTDESTGREG